MKTNLKCLCCGREIENQRCSNCGFFNILSLDEASDIEIKNRAKKYRDNIIKKFQGFCIMSYVYHYDMEEKKFVELSQKSICIASKLEPSNDICWSTETFGLSIEDKDEEKTISVFYQFDGKENKVDFKIYPDILNRDFQVGLELTEDLKLILHLGNKDESIKSEPIDLIPKAIL